MNEEEYLDIEETQAEETEENAEINVFATIGEVFDDGVTLIFDGEETATEKHYKCNTTIPLVSGDRVKLLKDSGTYVVEYKIGNPMEDVPDIPPETHGIPSGGSNGQILGKNSDANYDVGWKNMPSIPEVHNVPSGGATGQMLVKNSNTNYDMKWTDQPSIPKYISSIKTGTSNFTSGSMSAGASKTGTGYVNAPSGSTGVGIIGFYSSAGDIVPAVYTSSVSGTRINYSYSLKNTATASKSATIYITYMYYS